MTTATFNRGKETPGTFRYDEVPPKGQAPVAGTLYLKKYFVEQLGNPDNVTITIEAS